MLIFWEEGIRMRLSHHFVETLPVQFFKGQGTTRCKPLRSLQVELWGPYKWPKINGKTGVFHNPTLYGLGFSTSNDWLGAHLAGFESGGILRIGQYTSHY